MKGNIFADIKSHLGPPSQYGIATPPGTKLDVEAPHQGFGGERSSIRLKNHYCTITIDIRQGGGMVGASSYFMVLNMNQIRRSNLEDKSVHRSDVCYVQSLPCGPPRYAEIQTVGLRHNKRPPNAV